MRISDWSSDVCSSDLNCWRACKRPMIGSTWAANSCPRRNAFTHDGAIAPATGPCPTGAAAWITCGRAQILLIPPLRTALWNPAGDGRSEEHTSELQSLMRISYAVFCLKKKKNIIHEELMR